MGAQIEAAGAKGVAVQGDMSKEASAAGLVQAALDAFGRLDVWVNNAGLEIPAHTHEMTLENWQKIIDVNLTGYFLGARCVAAFCRQGHQGQHYQYVVGTRANPVAAFCPLRGQQGRCEAAE